MDNYLEDIVTPNLPYIPNYDYDVYHDISGKFSNNEWCVVGILWVPTFVKPRLIKALYQAREEEQYWGNIHYCDLSARFDRDFEAKERVAYSWVDLYCNHFVDKVYFSAYAIDRASDNYDKIRFKYPFHEANYWTCRTLNWAGQDFLSKEGVPIARFSSHFEARPSKNKKRDGIDSDNFPKYLTKQCCLAKGFPFRLFEPIEIIPTPREHTGGWITTNTELIRLTDLLTGSLRNAICATSHVQTKAKLAIEVGTLALEARTNWQLAHHFKVWYFPNHEGKTYKEGPLPILTDRVPVKEMANLL